MKNIPALCYGLILSALLIPCLPLSAAGEADSLINLLKKHPERDTVKANLLLTIAQQLLPSDPEASLLYADQLEKMAGANVKDRFGSKKTRYLSASHHTKGRSYLFLGQARQADSAFRLAASVWRTESDLKGEATAWFKAGRACNIAGLSKEALGYYEKALAIQKDFDDKTEMAVTLYQMGSTHQDMSNFVTSRDLVIQALGYFKQNNDELRMSICYNTLGNIQLSLGDDVKAISYFLSALSLSEKLKNDTEMSNNLNNIGIVYLNLEQYSKARTYFLRANALLEKSENESAKLYSLGNIGITYSAENNFEKALYYFNQVLVIAQRDGSMTNIAQAYNSIARVYEDSGNIPEALKYYKQALEINEEAGDKFSMIYNLVGLGDLSRTAGRFSEGASYFQRARAIAQEIGAPYPEKDALQGLTSLYQDAGRFDSAFKYLTLFSQLKDTLLNQENIAEIARKEVQYDFDKKIVEEKLLSELEINRQKSRKNIFLVSGLGLLVMAGGLYSRLRYIRRSRAVIQKEKDRSENLLLNILPAEVAEELKDKGYAEARHFDEVTVLFTDFKGFTSLAEQLTPTELVTEIDYCFRNFDEIITRYGIEKIKTIGDAYMCAGGLPVANRTNPTDVVKAALDIQRFMQEMKLQRISEGRPFFELRLGIHTGPVVAGIVGIKKFQYDIWGDTVNLASRMESSGEVGKVNVSQMTWEKINADFECTYRGKIEAKNKGTVDMYFVDRQVPTAD